jgi:signal transduction histidine kinase/DNA-binding response OmpR family regulator/ligand-binding sensor domain-containing protein
MTVPPNQRPGRASTQLVRRGHHSVRRRHGLAEPDTGTAVLDTARNRPPTGRTGRERAWGVPGAALACALTLAAPEARATTRPAQAPGWIVDQWTSEDGLPMDHAMDVVRTPDGIIWIATAGGLVRFDGVQFETLDADDLPGLRTSRQTSLAVSPEDGALWVLSDHGQAISRLHDGRLEVFNREHGFPATPNALIQDAGGIWLSTDMGLYELTERPEPRFEELELSAVSGTVLSPDGARWIASTRGEEGVVRIDPGGEVVRFDTTHGVPGVVGRILPGPGGAPLLLPDTDAPVSAWDGVGFGPVEVDRARSAGWFVALDSTVPLDDGRSPWALTTRGIHHEGALIEPFSGRITSAFEAPDGSLWLTSFSAGLLRVRPSSFTLVRSDSVDQQVSAVFSDASGRLWLRGLESWWTVGEDGAEIPAEHGRRVLGYLLEDSGVLTMAYGAGLWQIVPDARARPRPMLTAEGIFEHTMSSHTDPEGRLWLGDRQGLFVRVGSTWTERRTPDGAPIREVRDIEDHPQGGLLLASAGRGLLWLDGAGALSRLDQVSGVLSDNIRHIRLDDDRLWLATEDAGLCTVPLAEVATQPWRCVDEGAGLPAPGAHVSVPDGLGRVWVSTNYGIAVARGEELDAFARGEFDEVGFLVLDRRHGMASSEANGGNDQAFARGADGVLWFPTQRGAAGIRPVEFDFPEAPSLRLDRLLLGNDEVTADPLSLASDHAPLKLRWTVAESIWADQVSVRWRVGRGPWSHPERARELILSSLPTGDFRIELQAGLAGAWGPGVSVVGRRAPRLEERRSFYLFIILIGAMFTGAIFRLREFARRARERQLEAEVEARTAQLAESTRVLEQQKDQLGAQATRLEQLDELRTRMIVNLNHELRTPVSLVIGPLDELLGRADTSDHARRCGELALRNAQELEKLVDQLSDIARLEAGELPMRVRRVELEALVRRTIDRLEHMAEQRGIALTGPVEGATVLWCDPALIDKALGNLIHNALKFTPEGETVTVALERDDEWVRICVLDRGPGIEAADRGRVFERLYQVDRGDRRRHGGTGLGLSLAKEVVELHGGRIGVEPRSEGGSAFWFTLPVEDAPHTVDEVALEPATDALAPRVAAEPEPQGEGPLALVVEDHPDMRAFLAAQLAACCRVLSAPGGQEALALARAERPAIIVSDVMMPGMTGLELARALRADEALATVPILLVSAKAAVEDRVAGLEVADDYLVKPFRVAELRARVHRLVGRGSEDAPAGEQAPLPEADRATLERLQRAAREGLSDPDFGVAQLARACAMSDRTLRRELHRLAGMPPATWLRERRLIHARELLEAGTYRTVGELAAAVGMSRSYFSRAYHAWAGRAPGEELRVGQG